MKVWPSFDQFRLVIFLFQLYEAACSFARLPMFNADESFFRNALVLNDALCPSASSQTSFVRVSTGLNMAVATIASSLTLDKCAHACRMDSEPSSGAFRPCRGFNHHAGDMPICELFDTLAGVGPINENVGRRSYYYNKICLDSRFFECHLRRCTCELLTVSRHDVSTNFSHSPGVDYYESNCLTRTDRCSRESSIHFIRTPNARIPGEDVILGKMALGKCLDSCLSNSTLLCRSVEHCQDTNTCRATDEALTGDVQLTRLALRAATGDQPLAHVFEPICLPEPTRRLGGDPKLRPLAASNVDSAPRHVEVQVPGSKVRSQRELDAPKPPVRHSQLARDDSRDLTQLSVSPQPHGRRFGPISANDKDKKTKGGPTYIDVGGNVLCGYELKAENRELAEYFRIDHENIGSLVACHIMCAIWRDTQSNCRSLSYARRRGLCSLSQYDLSDLNVQKLTKRSEDADFYVRSECDLPKQNAPVRTPRALAPTPPSNSHSGSRVRKMSLEQLSSLGRRRSFNDAPVDPTDSSLPWVGLVNALNALTDPTNESPTALTLGSELSPSQLPDELYYVDENADELQTQDISDGSRLDPKSTGNTNNNGQNMPMRSTNVNDGGGIEPDNLLLTATCLPSGVNVTVTLSDGQENVLSGVVIISNDMVLPYDVTTKDDLFYEISCDYTPQSGSLSSLSSDGVLVKGGIVVGGPTPRVIAAQADAGQTRIPKDVQVELRILRRGRRVQNVLLGEQLTMRISATGLPSSQLHLDSCNVTRVGGTAPPPDPLNLLRDGCPLMEPVLGSVSRVEDGLQAPLTAFRIDGSAEIQIACLVRFCPNECPELSCAPNGGGPLNALGSLQDRAARDSIDRRLADNSIGSSPNSLMFSRVLAPQAWRADDPLPGTLSIGPDRGTNGTGGKSKPRIVTTDGILRVFVPGEAGAPERDSDDKLDDLLFDDPSVSLTYKNSSCVNRSLFYLVLGILLTVLVGGAGAVFCLVHTRRLNLWGTVDCVDKCGGYGKGIPEADERSTYASLYQSAMLPGNATSASCSVASPLPASIPNPTAPAPALAPGVSYPRGKVAPGSRGQLHPTPSVVPGGRALCSANRVK